MIARLLISPLLYTRINAIKEELKKNGLAEKHPDLLYFGQSEKLGIAEARKIKGHFALKPYAAKGRAVIIEDTDDLTVEAQNALLKTIEELPEEAILILGANSNANLLPTILSRCKITSFELKSYDTLEYHSKHLKDLERLPDSSIEERFGYIEKLKDKEEFLHATVYFFRQKMLESTHKRSIPKGQTLQDFMKELLQAEEWARQNVNIRAILEYLMLVMPKRKW